MFLLKDLHYDCSYHYTDHGKLQQDPNGKIVKTELSVRYYFIWDPKNIKKRTLRHSKNKTEEILKCYFFHDKVLRSSYLNQ